MAQTIGIKLDPEMKSRLEALGKKRDRSPHWLMKTAIMEYVSREEEIEEENRICDERWERYLATGEHVTQAEMEIFFDELIAQSQAKIAAANVSEE